MGKDQKLIDYKKVEFDSHLGVGNTIRGGLDAKGNYRIAGVIIGDINEVDSSNGILFIDKTAQVQGNIFYTNLIIAGKLGGNVIAASTVEILESAVAKGDIHCQRLNIHPTAMVNGRLSSFNEEQIKKIINSLPPSFKKA